MATKIYKSSLIALAMAYPLPVKNRIITPEKNVPASIAIITNPIILKRGFPETKPNITDAVKTTPRIIF